MDKSRIYILPEKDSKKIDPNDDYYKGKWTPTFEDIEKVEPCIVDYLNNWVKEKDNSDNESTKKLINQLQKNKLESYYRQYVGYVLQYDSIRILSAHFIDEQSIKEYPDWNTKDILVSGGRGFNLTISMDYEMIDGISY